MLLNDSTIRKKVESDEIVVEPDPVNEQYQPASLDVRISGNVKIGAGKSTYKDEKIPIPPKTPVLASTVEYVELPDDVAAQMTGRSSIGRMGLIVHKTAGWIDPGFEGEIVLEIYNFNDYTVRLDVGQRVAQLLFFQMNEPAQDPYDGKYQEQRGPTDYKED